jgi:hypothetical protein
MNIALSLLALFVIAHGLIHLSYATPQPKNATGWPFQLEHSWLLSSVGLGGIARQVGLFLGVVTTIGFVLAGLGLLGVPWLSDAWQTLMIVGAAASILLLTLFWNRMLIMGLVIDAGLMILVLWDQSTLPSFMQG